MAAYEYLGSDYAIPDFNVAQQNMNSAIWECKDVVRFVERNAATPERIAGALRAYRVCRERLLSIQPYVNRGAGHRDIPEVPPGFEKYATPPTEQK
ncbi:hypothetical protein GCM10023094_09360 [Rhodococcus olei]|uniref:Uncharacterized protein n=1 Tax=Rhodococcus olei TaxID=2161675 RepID=A0ABP8NY57_9NOCA